MSTNYFNRTNLVSAIGIGVFWWMLAVVQAFYEYAVLHNYNAITEEFNLLALLNSTFILLLAGFLAGLVLFPKAKVWLRTHSYGKAIVFTIVGVSVLYGFISALGSFVYNSIEQQAAFYEQAVLVNVVDYLMGTENLKNYLFWLFVGIATLIAVEVNDKYGPGNFRNFLSGKYFRPRMEDRILMFLDIRSATTIAEQLDELQYFNLLRDFFRDITPGILRTGGDIYQYVGDEIVISWKLARDGTNDRCIRAHFEIKKDLEKKSQAYRQKYGLAPVFKSGVHCGRVVAGEIGIIKRDISFSGDVVNTASRIQAKCNELGVDLLLSEAFVKQLEPNGTSWNIQPLGKVELKGKRDPMQVFTVR